MSEFLKTLWQLNIELSLLLSVTLLARYAVRKTTKNYNAYLLWLSIPVGLLLAMLASQIDLAQPPVETVGYIVHNYVVEPAESFSAWATLGYLWLMIAASLLLRLAVQHSRLRQELKTIAVPLPSQLNSRFRIIGIDKADFSPAVYGFVWPTIYFPVQLLSELRRDQIGLIIQHEEHHIKQKHLWLNLLWDILVCLMWFNPFVYVSRQSFRHDQELFCDYLVLHKSSRHDQQSYGHALLSTVSATHSVSLLCSWKSFNQLEERIMNIKNSSSLSNKLFLSLCGLAIVASTSLYTVSAADYAEKKVIKVIEDDSSEHRNIRIEEDGKTFVEEDGDRYILEYDQRRPMTDEESLAFDAEVSQAKKHAHGQIRVIKSTGEVGEVGEVGEGPHKVIKIIRGVDGVDIDVDELSELAIEISGGMMSLSEEELREFAEDMKEHAMVGMSEIDMQKIAEEMRGFEFEIEKHHSEFARAEREVEEAMREIEAAHEAKEITAVAMEAARAQLEATRSALGYEKENMRRSLDQARAEISQLRDEIEKSKRPD